MDVEGSIARGEPFAERIEQAVASARAMVVIVGRSWLSCVDSETGRRRLEMADDWVAKELGLALQQGMPVTR